MRRDLPCGALLFTFTLVGLASASRPSLLYLGPLEGGKTMLNGRAVFFSDFYGPIGVVDAAKKVLKCNLRRRIQQITTKKKPQFFIVTSTHFFHEFYLHFFGVEMRIGKRIFFHYDHSPLFGWEFSPPNLVVWFSGNPFKMSMEFRCTRRHYRTIWSRRTCSWQFCPWI